MRTVEYTDSFSPDSSVISEVFYDEDSKELFVHLHNGAKVGYRGVAPYTYRHFKGAVSAGHFWNNSIKNNPLLIGISGDVALFKRNSDQTVNVNDASQSEFTVTVELSGTMTFTGTANSGNEALRKVQEALQSTFVGASKVKELKQTFV